MVTMSGDTFVNSELGTITKLKQKSVVFRSDSGAEDKIKPATWTYYQYGMHEDQGVQRLDKDKIGSYKQLPLRLAWAVSIHKSQG